MNWLTNLPPGFKSIFAGRGAADNLWVKCPKSGELVYRQDLENSDSVTPAGAHLRVEPRERFKSLFDGEAWSEIDLPVVERDPLRFKDDKRYSERLKAARAQAGREDCMVAGKGRVGGCPAVILVQDFAFMGGSLGQAAGAAFIRAVEVAIENRCALICVTASGGARMQEGTLSLMQMPRTVLAVRDMNRAGLPYIVLLTNPTSGGVLASYAMLGDVHIAEPDALIAFTGPRVIEQTLREKLPEGFQRSEFLLKHGMVDMVVDRRELPNRLGMILGHLMLKADVKVRPAARSAVTPVTPVAAARKAAKAAAAAPRSDKAGAASPRARKRA